MQTAIFILWKNLSRIDKTINTLYIINMIKVKVREGEPIDRALKRLKKKLKDEEILDSVRQRRYFVPKSEKKKKAKQTAYYAQLMQEYKNQ